MDERLNKLLWLIEKLPADQIVIIAEKCKWYWEVSPKVQKLISVFDKLSEEEKDQFFRNVTKPSDAIDWRTTSEITEADVTADWSTDCWESNE